MKLIEILKEKPIKILITIVVFFTIFFSTYSIIKHNNFNSYALDLGIYDQTVWRYSQLNGDYENTVLGINNLLGDHFEPILIPFGAVYKVIPDVSVLLIAQAFALSVTIIPLFFLIKKRTNEPVLAILMCFSYLLFFGIQSTIDFDFHPIVLAVPCLIAALYFLEEKKYIWTFVFLVISLLCKESVTFYIVFFGIYALLTKKNIYFSLGLIGFGVASFYALTKVFMPHFAGKSYQYFQFTAFGNSLDEAIINIIKNPFKVVTTIFSNQTKLLTYAILFGSTGLIVFLGGYGLILIIPMLAERFLSDRPNGWSPFFHYSATIAPFLFWLTAIGIMRIKTFIDSKNIVFKYNIVNVLACGVLVVTVLISLIGFKDKKAPIFNNITKASFYTNNQNKSIERALTLIGPEDSVSAQNTLVPHLSHRDKIYLYPKVADAKYILLNSEKDPYPLNREALINNIEALKTDAKCKLEFTNDETYLFKCSN